MLLLGNDNETYGIVYEVIYDVIQTNSGASLGLLWAVNVTRNIEQLTCISSEYNNYKLPFMLSNNIQFFEHMWSLSLCNTISIWHVAMHASTSVNDPLLIVAIQLLGIWSRVHLL